MDSQCAQAIPENSELNETFDRNNLKNEFNNFITNVSYLIQPQKKSRFEQLSKEFKLKNFNMNEQPPKYVAQLSQNVEITTEAMDIEKDMNELKNQKKTQKKSSKLREKLEKLKEVTPQIVGNTMPDKTNLKSIILECLDLFKEIDKIQFNLLSHQYRLGARLKYLKIYCSDNGIIFVNFIQKYFMDRTISTINKYINLYCFIKKFPKLSQLNISMREILSSKKEIETFFSEINKK